MTVSHHADIERRALRDQVYDRIREMLLLDELEPGQRIFIDTLARELRVSPTPVREAMVHLERTGLVAREALKGYRVAEPLSRKQLAELFEARLMLEVTAAKAASADPDVTAAELEIAHSAHVAVVDRITAMYRAGESIPLQVTQEYFMADADFHAVVFNHADNRYLSSMYEQLDAVTHRMRQAVHRGPADVGDAVAEHSAIIAAFRGGEVDAIVEAMTAHIAGVSHRALGDAGEE